ncbi:MAG: hypothetical protein L6Q45_12675 [Anaerolineales bacterium]|nr:hypothetical protein [Anaerolineales bacterium]
MSSDVIVSLISSIIGGVFVAAINLIFTRNRTNAEAKKFLAETEKIKVETEKIRSEIEKINSNILSASQEKIIYDGTKGINGYDITNSLGCNTKDGVLVFEKLNGSFYLGKYFYDNKIHDFLPKNVLISGARKLRVTCEAKVTEGSCRMSFVFRSQDSTGEFATPLRITVSQANWKNIDLYFRIPAANDSTLQVFLEPESETGSLQLRNLVLAENSV